MPDAESLKVQQRSQSDHIDPVRLPCAAVVRHSAIREVALELPLNTTDTPLDRVLLPENLFNEMKFCLFSS